MRGNAIASVRLSVCLFSPHLFQTDQHLTWIFCVCMGHESHDHSSPAAESQGHISRSNVKTRSVRHRVTAIRKEVIEDRNGCNPMHDFLTFNHSYILYAFPQTVLLSIEFLINALKFSVRLRYIYLTSDYVVSNSSFIIQRILILNCACDSVAPAIPVINFQRLLNDKRCAFHLSSSPRF